MWILAILVILVILVNSCATSKSQEFTRITNIHKYSQVNPKEYKSKKKSQVFGTIRITFKKSQELLLMWILVKIVAFITVIHSIFCILVNSCESDWLLWRTRANLAIVSLEPDNRSYYVPPINSSTTSTLFCHIGNIGT